MYPSERILALGSMVEGEHKDDTLRCHQRKKMVPASLSKAEGKYKDGVYMLDGKDDVHQKKKKKVPIRFNKVSGDHKNVAHQCLHSQRISQQILSLLMDAF